MDASSRLVAEVDDDSHRDGAPPIGQPTGIPMYLRLLSKQSFHPILFAEAPIASLSLSARPGTLFDASRVRVTIHILVIV